MNEVSERSPDDDVRGLDQGTEAQRLPPSSAVVHKAVQLLRASELGAAYEDACSEWADSGGAAAWDATVADGLTGQSGDRPALPQTMVDDS